MKAIFALFSFTALAACADHDLRALSTIEPLGGGKYKWRTLADAVYPVDDPVAEEQRLEQLGKVMALNAECAGGYRITDRRAVLKVQGIAAGIYDVYYYVSC